MTALHEPSHSACACVAGAWQPDLTWITDDLAIGGRVPADRIAHLAEVERVGAVVDLRSEDRDDSAHLARHGIAFLHLPTDDHGALSPAAIRRGLGFAAEQLRAGRRLLVHCQHGIGRSSTLALCIMVERGFEPMAALGLAKDRRSLVSPSPAQYECWTAWLRSRPLPRGGKRAVPDFDSFKAIAYRHLWAEKA